MTSGSIAEQVGAVAFQVETFARHMREDGVEPKYHLIGDEGVTEMMSTADLFDIVALALRGIESAANGGGEES